MSTRKRSDLSGPMSQNRYMSSPEFAELRGVNGICVKDKAAITPSHQKRRLLWALQAKSLEEGGLRRLSNELISMFPERFLSEWGSASSIEEFLIDLCINPRLHIALPGEDAQMQDFERERAQEQYSGLGDGDFESARLRCFKDIIGALLEYFRRHEAQVKNRFQATEVSRQIWQTLDFGLKTKGMVLIDGLEGRGKTEAAKAWCQLHLGESRFVSLKGINSKTAAFREIAKALGVASSYTRNAFEMQARVEDLLERAKLMLVIDEAHWLFNQSARVYTRPELVDWIVTGVCNRGVPIALVTTPQFLRCMARVIEQVEWNHRQFQRRVARRKVLPSKNTVQDIEAVTRSVFPKASNSTIQRIVGYVVISKRDLSALGDIAREIRFLINPDDATSVDLTKTRIEFDQVEAVIDSNLIPSDSAFAQDLGAVLQKQGRKPRSVRGAVRSLPHLDDEQDGCSDDSDSRNVHCKAPAIAVPGKGNAPVETLGAPETRSIIPDLGQRRRADELLSPDISSGCGSKIQQKTAALK